ncbi:glycoside hydrolase family 3 C-terminal domain-containing protein [Kribbella monticola]|uniref:glycoside hydrolase family 3 C-terminal domain-containing protein n=1 Tax=Kribbella monticola TaxID=2185285 RepID=UPI000DD2CFEC|nr:glycoside hydrolase family 3 C-terminal domain-containing protein [Kribbella monticola]
MAELSTAEQAALGSGADFWTTKQVGAVPAIVLTDGPHGVRKQVASSDQLGIAENEPATCFPPAAGLGQSWDPELVERVGTALGRESQAMNVQVLLGPGINIKRDPRCGRNFEYYSEDPYLSGVLGAAWVRGVQGEGVGACVKHFAANNQEHDRMRVSADVDPRTLREIYLRAFHRVVTEANPWSLMCSYNRINGVLASQNEWLLTKVLRDEWGFEGVVISDWGAVADRPAAVAAGLDLEMPGATGTTDNELVVALSNGTVDPAHVARAAERVAALAIRTTEAHRADASFDADAHHQLARDAAAQSIVLLQNADELLPLDSSDRLAVIGEFAEKPRYQGGGSSHVTPTRLDVPLDEIRAHAEVTYAPGFSTDGSGDAAALRDDAVQAAAATNTAVVFLGLAARQESEGADRTDIEIPAEQLELLTAVVAAQPRTVVVLIHGSVLRIAPVAAIAPAVLDAALLGQGGGAAIAEVLFGRVNPSGKLTETVPVRLRDVPAYGNFPGENGHVLYGEGLHVGYRWYDARDLAVAFPFGHGLSYTTFDYSDLVVEATDAGLQASVTITNTGKREGREVAQFYVSLPGSAVTRAPQQLVAFAHASPAPGESTTIQVTIDRGDLAYWDVRADRWVVESGEYVVSVGSSSRDLRANAAVSVTGDEIRLPITLDSTIAEILRDPIGAEALGGLIESVFGTTMGEEAAGADMGAMLGALPVGRLVGFSGGRLTRAELEQLLVAANPD